MPFKDPEVRKAYLKEYYQENREEILLKKKAYHSRPEVKARLKVLRDTPEYKAKAREQTAKWYKENREEKALYQKARRKTLILLPSGNTITTSRKDQLKSEYGLTAEQYDKMEQEQMNKCALCGEDFTEEDGPCVDHNHKTGFVRGLLHHKCNSAIGHLDDNPKKAELAKIYLEESERKEKLEKLKEHNRKNNNIVPFKEGEDEQENN